MSIFYSTDFVFALSVAIFLAIIVYYGVHKLVLKGLDERAERIRRELDEARQLREEAQKTFAEFERKSREVDSQAEEIVAHARHEAERSAEKAKQDIAESIERRLKAADEQIGMAERDAVREVRDRAVQVAIAAAGDVMRQKITDGKAAGLIDDAIATVERRLH